MILLNKLLCLLIIYGNLESIDAIPNNPNNYKIGGVFSLHSSQFHFNETIKNLNFDLQYVNRGVVFYHTVMTMDSNPIRTALSVCKTLISERVYAVVISHPPVGDLSPAAVSYTAGFYHIPVIGISSRDSAFSDKNIHVSFLRTVPPYSHQAEVWVEMLKYFSYTKVIFIHSSDTDGRSLLGRFQTTSQSLEDDVEIKVHVETVIEFEPGLESFTSQLRNIREAQARVCLMYASKRDAEIIFRDLATMNMTGSGYVWIATEQSLEAKNAPEGLIGLKLVNASDEKAHITDSLYVLVSALREMNETKVITEAPKDCDNSGTIWETGKDLFGFIRKQVLEKGATGRVAFDDNGDRIYSEYNIVNVQEGGVQNSIGQYYFSLETRKMLLRLNETSILWPGRQTVKPEGLMIPTHLKVLTIPEKPFVYVRVIQEEECLPDEIPCPHYDNTTVNKTTLYCCKGYCIELLKALAKTINFTYDLALSPDGQFGHYVINDLTAGNKKVWTGLIGELVYERADMIVAPLTINPERAEFIEFSKPFKYQGITILEKKPSRSSTLVSFLQPFSNTLWILVMVSVHVVALALYLLDRFSPFGRFKLANADGTEEDALNLSSAVWFAWGVLLNSGIGEGTPRSFSARVLGMVWAGFAMIIVASYTANLAAFLVLERPKTKLTGINDARLRNTMENLTCATVKGSAVDMYFRRQVELSNMYRTMEANNYDTVEDAIHDVKIGKLMAFIWDSSRLEFEAAKDCELVTAGELFGRSGYGVGLQKGSPWTDAVTLAILDFHEGKIISRYSCHKGVYQQKVPVESHKGMPKIFFRKPTYFGLKRAEMQKKILHALMASEVTIGCHKAGFMETLDKEWILQGSVQQCEVNDNTPNTLGLKNMAGVFILVAIGIVGGVGLIIIEVAYKKHQNKKQKRLDLARHMAEKWRRNVQKRKILRAQMMGPSTSQQRPSLNEPGTSSVSLAVDNAVASTSFIERTSPRSPGRAWPGDRDFRTRDRTRTEDIRLSPITYPVDISHLVV